MLYCPNKTNLFGENLCCPNKTKKTLPRASAKKIGFIGTVQHFLPLGFEKCCTALIKPIFLADALGRLKKIGFIGFIGTIQHFSPKRWVLLGQYSTFCLWALKSAVLSQ